MASYVVMVPPADQAARQEHIVRDGFHWLAFLVPFLWLLWHRLWIEAALALGAMLGLSTLASLEGWSAAASVLSLALSLFIGLEAAALRVAALRRRGWEEWGVVEAETLLDAETRYLADAAGAAPAPASPAVPPIHARQLARVEAPALGFLGYSGRT